MEPEAELDRGSLLQSVGSRRRTTSFSDDYSIHKTNEDATECKIAAVCLGYWKDPFICRFVQSHGDPATELTSRRDPEISRGYWARVAAISRLLLQFLAKAGDKCQIINLGAGFDTLYWRLKSENRSFGRYVEVDFSSVTAKKIRLLKKPGHGRLVDVVSGGHPDSVTECGHTDLHGPDFSLVGADLRQIRELRDKLGTCQLNRELPTLVICECVLIYMSPDESAALLQLLSQSFDTIAFINYEQVNLNDRFGEVMQQNLLTRGLCLPGLVACHSLESQKQRFLENGFHHVTDWRMDQIYQSILPKEEVERIERIELLDEKELLIQLLEHYCVVFAFKNGANIGLNKIV